MKLRHALPLSFALVFLATCQKAPKLKGIAATETRVESTVTTLSSGTVTAQQQAILGFGTAGRVSKTLVKLGDIVRKGRTIAQLENKDLFVVYRDSLTELERSKRLFAHKLVSKTSLDSAMRAAAVAKANLEKTFIKAPFDGQVTELNIELGGVSQPSPPTAKPLVRLVDLRPRTVRGEIDETDLVRVKKGMKARVRVPAARKEAFDGVVDQVVQFVNTSKEQDRTSQISIQILNDGENIPVGASAEIEIITDLKPKTLALPSRAIFGSGNQRYVYVHRDGKLEKTPIEVGIGNYDRSEVLSGINHGDIIALPTEEVELANGLRSSIEVAAWP